MKKLLKSKKALSPVVAAIILIAVTVAVSIAVAVWMGSLTFNFMDTEPLTITKVNFQDLDIINVTLLNTGTANVLLTGATVEGQGLTGTTVTMVGGAATIINDGTEQMVDLTLTTNATAGNLYNIELISSKGNKYQYSIIAGP
ncbi:MAG: hypothetical protein JSW14_07230 [Candidatus Bathyarchaeum sp.]|nr:MAG: hypothetical protein JSW14_07230 [Candidatus Bathyarchaeum sp.]